MNGDATATTCRCGRPTRDSAYFCDTCGRTLSDALGDVAWLEDELETTITRAKGVDYRTAGGTRGSEKPSPVNWGASDARRQLRDLLASWVLFCHETNVPNSSPIPGLPAPELIPLSRYLLWRVDGLSLLDIGPEIIDELVAAVEKCRRAIDTAPDKMYAGRCSDDCPEDLYAKVGAKTITCRVCDTRWDVKERREWLLKEAEEVLATAVEISRAVSWLGAEPLNADRVRQWANRDRLVVRGHDRKMRPLYRVGDAIDLLAKSNQPKDGAA